MIDNYIETYNAFISAGVEPLAAAAMTTHAIQNRFGDYLNADEVAEYLRVSRTTTDPLLSDGTIPCISFGKRKVVRKRDLENAMRPETEEQGSTKGRRKGYSLL